MSSRESGPDLYKILGLHRSTKADEITRAYRRLALATHPDKNLQDPTAKAKFQYVEHAHYILSNEASRSDYNSLNPAAGLSAPNTHGAQTAAEGGESSSPSGQPESKDMSFDEADEDSDADYGSEGDEYSCEEMIKDSDLYYGAQWDNPSDEEDGDSDDDAGSAGDGDPAWDESDPL